jgi:hypothetical protein
MRPKRAGVYLAEPQGNPTLVHAYSEDALEDLPELLGFGRWEEEDPPRLTLEARELRALATEVEARSFDLEEGLVTLVRDLRQATRDRPETVFVFLDHA